MIGRYETRRDAKKQVDCWITPSNNCTTHFHSSLEVNYCLKGSVSGMVNGRSCTLKKNDVLLCTSYTLHQFTSAQNTGECLVLTIPTDFVPSEKKWLSANTYQSLSQNLPEDNEVLRALLALEALCRQKSDNYILLKGYTYLVLGLLKKALGVCPASRVQSADVKREILLYLDAHFLEDLSAEDVATRFGYSKSHFLHIFSDSFGFGFCQYINLLRCRHAAMLMLSENMPLIDAAMTAGFNNLRSFYRNFKKVFGMTPSQYLETKKATT